MEVPTLAPALAHAMESWSFELMGSVEFIAGLIVVLIVVNSG